MKPEQFIREWGLPEAKRILKEAPKHSQFVIPCLDGEMYFSKREDDGKWFKWSNGYNKWLEYFGKCNPLDLAYNLSDLKRLVDSVDLVISLGGLKAARSEAHKDCFVYNQPLLAAIAAYESIYGGGDE
ncbi:TPA: hypothetical protein U2N26_002989 [Acinetobacter nosocomialis]|uniref:hypothetical protein n=1 Tax=Acinetobacter nosocomialis TaxID=106654 RepID=UPI001901AD4A|nr:hypothetical protein [Acinetobacter nosocomialis]MBJ8460520.1 hypothetical protein [Acinetobacter nosocomialis]MBZ6531441.1 hypothetical protein [Acinetobacter nosocomialis]HEM6635666.1 hypothetical protein [Acinetobacter nosocomialis]HEM7379617.1 hypothetical protein [Acinetobacter nosocomialis]HEM7794024.1 hypothetical protein [Acinetobacter nosocomialis]